MPKRPQHFGRRCSETESDHFKPRTFAGKPEFVQIDAPANENPPVPDGLVCDGRFSRTELLNEDGNTTAIHGHFVDWRAQQ